MRSQRVLRAGRRERGGRGDGALGSSKRRSDAERGARRWKESVGVAGWQVRGSR
jgi:hypothetical protein